MTIDPDTAHTAQIPSKPRLGLVIGSGGLKCAAAIGVMEVLEEAGIDIDLVVGCSGGAVFGAAIALGFTSEKMDQTRAQTWTKEITHKVDYRSLLRMVLPKLFGYKDQIGLFNDHALTNNLIKAFGPHTSFSDTKIPFYVVATDFANGDPVVLKSGRIADALRISSSIPIAFKPIQHQGKLLLDGGISNPLPIDIAIDHGADLIIAIGFETPMQPSVATPGNYAMQMFNILVNQLLAKKFAYYNLVHHSEIVAVIPEFKQNIQIDDVEQAKFIIDQGRKEMRRHVDYLKHLLDPTVESG